METTTINFKTQKKNKILLEQLCERIGISITSLLNMFINKSIQENGIPFKVGFQSENEVIMNRLKDWQMLDSHFGAFANLSKKQGIRNDQDVVKLIRQYRKDREQWK